MRFREIIIVCSENRTELVNVLRGENVALLNDQTAGVYSYDSALKYCLDIIFYCTKFKSQ